MMFWRFEKLKQLFQIATHTVQVFTKEKLEILDEYIPDHLEKVAETLKSSNPIPKLDEGISFEIESRKIILQTVLKFINLFQQKLPSLFGDTIPSSKKKYIWIWFPRNLNMKN